VASAWPEPPFAKFVGACDGVEAIALVGATTETRLNPAAEEQVVPARAHMKARQARTRGQRVRAPRLGTTFRYIDHQRSAVIC